MRGSTGVCIFEGILNAEGYVGILEDVWLLYYTSTVECGIVPDALAGLNS